MCSESRVYELHINKLHVCVNITLYLHLPSIISSISYGKLKLIHSFIATDSLKSTHSSLRITYTEI